MAVPIALTSVVISSRPEEAMREIETFLVSLSAGILKRKEYSIKAHVVHPDGFETKLKVKCHMLSEDDGQADVLEFTRRAGDSVLFLLVYRMFVASDMGRGALPSFYLGQILPKPPTLKPSSSPFQVPAIHLEEGGEKRKFVDVASVLADSEGVRVYLGI